MVRKVPEGIKDFFGMFPSKRFADGTCHFIGGMANSCVFETTKSLVIFDLPIRQNAQKMFDQVRQISDKPVKYFVYSHGHFDHAFGYAPFLEEIKKKRWDKPEVIAHENCIKRFEKYRLLDEYHDWINKMQFSSVRGVTQEKLVNATETLDPTIILRGNNGEFKFELGDINFELYHDKGETDDSIWLWVPEKKTICAGDLMISSFPNVGNPFKVQRYPKDWDIAMEKMMQKNAEYLVPGHGPLIIGKQKVEEVLSITAEVMHFVHDEVVKRLNERKWFEQIYHEMLEIYPDKFRNHKYLREIYGSYRFAIHATYRLYHGWYNSGNPTDLFPAKSEEIASELLKINNERKYLDHAKKLKNEGKLQLALHILDVIIKGIPNPDNETVLEALNLKYDLLNKITEKETSFIAINILQNAANEIRNKIKEFKKK